MFGKMKTRLRRKSTEMLLVIAPMVGAGLLILTLTGMIRPAEAWGAGSTAIGLMAVLLLVGVATDGTMVLAKRVVPGKTR